ncbi:hypothetical protein [Streptomyces sp. NPDC049555]|uniref:hypothetical protein n=1 Tax=Streptomyces sp. NPDC049555 TaxID=3154930 RepID=UPI0034162EAB
MITVNTLLPDAPVVKSIARSHSPSLAAASAAARLEAEVLTVAWHLHAARHDKSLTSDEDLNAWFSTLTPADLRAFRDTAVSLLGGTNDTTAGLLRRSGRRRPPRVQPTGRTRLTIR